MKKLLILLSLFISTLSFGQTIVYSTVDLDSVKVQLSSTRQNKCENSVTIYNMSNKQVSRMYVIYFDGYVVFSRYITIPASRYAFYYNVINDCASTLRAVSVSE